MLPLSKKWLLFQIIWYGILQSIPHSSSLLSSYNSAFPLEYAIYIVTFLSQIFALWFLHITQHVLPGLISIVLYYQTRIPPDYFMKFVIIFQIPCGIYRQIWYSPTRIPPDYLRSSKIIFKIPCRIFLIIWYSPTRIPSDYSSIQ